MVTRSGSRGSGWFSILTGVVSWGTNGGEAYLGGSRLPTVRQGVVRELPAGLIAAVVPATRYRTSENVAPAGGGAELGKPRKNTECGLAVSVAEFDYAKAIKQSPRDGSEPDRVPHGPEGHGKRVLRTAHACEEPPRGGSWQTRGAEGGEGAGAKTIPEEAESDSQEGGAGSLVKQGGVGGPCRGRDRDACDR